VSKAGNQSGEQIKVQQAARKSGHQSGEQSECKSLKQEVLPTKKKVHNQKSAQHQSESNSKTHFFPSTSFKAASNLLSTYFKAASNLLCQQNDG
jgi:hypothetical protein